MGKAWTWMLMLGMLATGLAVAVPPAAAQTTACSGPSNDCFANATTLPTSRPASFTVSNHGAGLETREPLTCFVAGASVWVRFTAQTNGRAYVDQTAPSPIALSLAAFEGTSLASLVERDCDGVSAGAEAALEFTCVAGQTYHLQIASASNVTGTTRFSLEGCGRTGVTYETGRYVTVADHESTSATSCWSVPACRQYADADVNVRVTADRTTRLDQNQGVNARLESSGRLAGRAYDLGEVGMIIPSLGPPPPPPGPGPGGRDLIAYAHAVREWAEGIEVYGDVFQSVAGPRA